MTGSKKRKWEELREDCLANIFQRLGLEELSVGVSLVCRSWHRASLNPLLWQDLDFRDLDLQDTDSSFAARFMAEYRLKSFSFSGLLKLAVSRARGCTRKVVFPCEHVSVEDWTCVSEQCPSLNILVLPDFMEDEVEKRLSDFICRWKELEWVCMRRMPISFKKILWEINRHCHRFYGLMTRGWITVVEVSWIITFLPKIKLLDLRGSLMSAECLMMILEGCRELELLDVKDCLGLVVDDRVLEKASRLQVF